MTLMFKQKDQSGMASFLIVTVIVTLMALVSLGFSRLSVREQRQSLDRGLSDQAYYAAESGLNDAINYVKNNPTAVKTTCDDPTNSQYFLTNGDLSGNGVAKYTCVLINSTPKKMSFTVSPNNPKSFKVSYAGLNNFFFSWENATGNDGSLGSFPNPRLPQESSLPPQYTGILGVTIYPAANGNGMDALAGNSKQFFFYPNGGTGTIIPTGFGSGGFAQGNCKAGTSNPAFCNGEITGLPAGYSTFYVNLSAYYQPLNVIFQATSGGSPVSLPGVEASIDVTGSGNDVLRRLQSYAPLDLNDSIPGYALQSMQSICKLFRAQIRQPGKYDATVDDPAQVDPDGTCFQPSGNPNDAIDNTGQGPPL